jgi:glycosyltransferase involved in cell wall biosynthesis
LHFHALKARARGYDISIGSFRENGAEPEFLKIIRGDGIRTVCFEVKGGYDLRAIGLIRNYLVDNKIDVFCTHDYRSHILGAFSSRGLPAKWVAFSRGITAENIKVRLFHRAAGFIIRYADHIVAVAGSEKSKLLKSGISENKISVIHNAIDADNMRKTERTDLRRQFGFPKEAIICISGGRFSPEKGQIFLVKAAARALQKQQNLHFIIFGDGPELEKIKGHIADYGIQAKVLCPGFEKKLLSFLSGADILINPSLSEGLPNIVLEAMALGIPVVATAVGGVPELIRHGESGLLASAENEGALADAILELAGSLTLRRQLAAGATQIIENAFSFDKQMKDLDEIYNNMRRQGPDSGR